MSASNVQNRWVSTKTANILLTSSREMLRTMKLQERGKEHFQDNEKIIILLNWLGREGLQFMQTLNDEEQEQ